jgi:S-adenosylmethionine:tRNA ribosyltransferase-isomerase
MPLPPYIEREDEAADRERYQTVYAEREGAVAAPTAGLHFDEALLATSTALGVRSTQLTLHVGAGTFQPVRADDIERARDARRVSRGQRRNLRAVRACRARGRAGGRGGYHGGAQPRDRRGDGELKPYIGDTRLFIYPGYRWRAWTP